MEETESTMGDARALAIRGAPEGSFVMADRQRAGRGRLPGRVWEASGGESLLFTVILDGANSQAIPLKIGIAVARAVASLEEDVFRMLPFEGTDPIRRGLFRGQTPRERISGGQTPQADKARIALKWPNDVLVGGKKVAGILCEACSGRVLAGIGVNCLQTRFDLRSPSKREPTSLFLAWGMKPDRIQLLSRILRELPRASHDPAWKAAYEGLLDGIGARVVFAPGLGADHVEAILAGVDDSGALILERADGSRESYASGELVSVHSGID